MNTEQKISLAELTKSLQTAFPEEMETAILEGGKEMRLRIGAKTVWLNETGQISGETSRISGSGFQIGIDGDGVGVATSRAAIAPSSVISHLDCAGNR